MAPSIQFQNVTKIFGNQTILRKANLVIEQGESVVLLGASGSGKSVLLRLVMNLDRPDRGRINLTPATQDGRLPIIGMVFQQSALFDTMTVGQNLQFAWQRLGRNGGQPYPLKQLLAEVSLSQADLHKKPADLSGGMAKRAALARALIARPQLLLYDEPTAGLDPVTAEQIAQLIRHVHLGSNKVVTSLTVTHDYGVAAWIADRVLYLDAKEHQVRELISRAEIEEIRGCTDLTQEGEICEQAVADLSAVLEAKAKVLHIFERPVGQAQSNQPNPFNQIIRHSMAIGLGLIQAIAGLRPPGNLKSFAHRLLDFGLGSVPYIAGSGLLIGVAMATMLTPILADFGVTQQLPNLLTTALLQEVAPLLTALLLAGRFGASIAAELGAMLVTEQLDALRTLKETPESYLLTPILQAVLLLQPLLTLLFIASALGGGYLSMTIGALIRPRVYEYGTLTTLNEVGLGIIIIKSLVFGLIIALTGYQIGKTTRHSASGVGRASRSAVVYASMFIIIANLILNQGLIF